MSPGRLLATALAAVLFAASLPGGVLADSVDFNRDIRPLLSDRCAACHGPDEAERQAGLRLDTREGSQADLGGYAAIVPGKPEESELWIRITADDEDLRMPPPGRGEPLQPDEIDLLTKWIESGAEYDRHWSHTPPRRPPLPRNFSGEPTANEIDLFLLAKLKSQGLDFSPEADRYTLARRVALDLTGLPPTWAEVQAFVTDPGEDAYAAYVDRVLEKAAFGEHWARLWLDLARYADSSGYPSDQPRQIWGYRDWVIAAFNRNLPFDTFTIEQLAGDLLPSPTDEQQIATAFHRNTMTQNEGGTSDEEFRVAAVVDRVNTTMAVWMGTTMACAQCHTHKYDPITQREYFEFFAILNQTADADRQDESPLHRIFSPQQLQQRNRLTAALAELERVFSRPPENAWDGFEDWLQQLKQPSDGQPQVPLEIVEAAGKPDAASTDRVRDYFLRNVSPQLAETRKLQAELTKQFEAIKPKTVPVMVELTGDERRETRIQRRGNWADLGEEVGPGVPAAFSRREAELPQDRLELARWLVSRDNPLTARVTVNRFWEAIFGTGIVRTSEDFGVQGELPSHPELLDWLAVDFMEHGWDVKRLLKQFVTSRAYRQRSRVTPKLREIDPRNRLLARGPRFRPTGEQLRDQALFVSGLLTHKIGGPAVRPLAPNLGLTTAFGRSNDWTPSEGEDRYRRSVYTEVRRNAPYASFSTFDGPNREVCTIRRNRTNTPLQAFVTLNDPVFVETHQSLARLLMRHGDTVDERLTIAIQRCLAREPRLEELEALREVYSAAMVEFAADREAALKLATEPLGPAPETVDVRELGAWTTVAGVIMNLDEFLMRR